MTNKELALERLHRNGVLSPFSSMEMCARNLAGIQAQVQQFSELAVLNRCSGSLSMKKLDEAYRSHRFINLWGQRNTLHMYAAGDWDLLCDVYHNKTYIQRHIPACPEFFSNIAEHIKKVPAKGNSLNRTQIHEWANAHAPAPLKNLEWLTYMVLNYLCANGVLFGIPAKPSIRDFAHFDALGKTRWQWSPESLARSLDELLLRYFQYYGPATLQDFRHWSGLPAKIARESLDRVEDRLNMANFDKRPYYTFGNIAVKNTRRLALLGKFDPLFVSYCHKDWIVPAEQQKQIWRKAGHVEAVVLDGAKLLGTWRHSLKGNKMTVHVEPLAAISDNAKERIRAKAGKLAAFWQKKLEVVVYK